MRAGSFEQQLTHDLKTARTERGADRDLAFARRGACQKKIRHVRARDQEDERDRRDQHEQGRPDVADQVRLQGNRAFSSASIFIGILLSQLRRDGLQVRGRRPQIDALFQTADDGKKMRPAPIM